MNDLAKYADQFTPCGLKLEGGFENKRNQLNADLFKWIIRKCYGVGDVIIGHHIVYVATEKRKDEATGNWHDYTIVEEIPSADALIFNHKVARHLFGDRFKDRLAYLATLDTVERDAYLWQCCVQAGMCPVEVPKP